MRVVLDTNVIIAAFASHGLCHLLFESVLSHHEVISSDSLLLEVETSLAKKIRLPKTTTGEIVRFLRRKGIHVIDFTYKGLICRDTDDIKILSVAITGKADWIVTGDQDLLILKHCREIPIVKPRDFWDILRGNS